uniref:hypothetical protein n=1 Tax=Actinomyces dentalis TaxID=272548 RepID=UPI002353A0DF
ARSAFSLRIPSRMIAMGQESQAGGGRGKRGGGRGQRWERRAGTAGPPAAEPAVRVADLDEMMTLIDNA